jgi:hypothetical protein
MYSYEDRIRAARRNEDKAAALPCALFRKGSGVRSGRLGDACR